MGDIESIAVRAELQNGMFPAPQLFPDAVQPKTNQVNRALTSSGEGIVSESAWATGDSETGLSAIWVQRFRPGLKRQRQHERASSLRED